MSLGLPGRYHIGRNQTLGSPTPSPAGSKSNKANVSRLNCCTGGLNIRICKQRIPCGVPLASLQSVFLREMPSERPVTLQNNRSTFETIVLAAEEPDACAA